MLKQKNLFEFILLLIVSISSFNSTAQSKNTLNLELNFYGTALELDKSYYHITLEDSVSISSLKFYIGKFYFYKNDKLIKYSDQYFLVDATKAKSLQLALDAPDNYDALNFDLGVDSVTNNRGALGGDLDPMNNMYWSWQSGYINFKLEGTSPSCPTRKNKFQFHVGGYLKPFVSVVKVKTVIVEKLQKNSSSKNDWTPSKEKILNDEIEVHNTIMGEFRSRKKTSNKEEAAVEKSAKRRDAERAEGGFHQPTLILNLNQFFNSVNIRESYQVMSPGDEAVETAEKIATLFMLTL